MSRPLSSRATLLRAADANVNVTQTGTQTLTNKTLTKPVADALLLSAVDATGNIPNAPAATAPVSSYPVGTSMQVVSNDASWPSPYGLVTTQRYGADARVVQQFDLISNAQVRWVRTWLVGGGGAWGAWAQVMRDPGAWTSFTPQLLGSTTNPTMGSGTGAAASARYAQIGKTVFYQGSWGFGATGFAVGAGNYSISLPVNWANVVPGNMGALAIYVNGSGWVNGWLPNGGLANALIYAPTGAAGTMWMNALTATSTIQGVAIGAGTAFRWNMVYEAA